MPKNHRIPTYRQHKPTGQAVVTLNGRDHYLGRWDTDDSRAKYHRHINEWLANHRQPQPAEGPKDQGLLVSELIARYWAHVESYYVKDGKPSTETHAIKSAMRPLNRLYGNTPAEDFGPLALTAVREEMIRQPIVYKAKVENPDTGAVEWRDKVARHGLTRKCINKHIRRIKAMFGWAVAQELIPAEVHQALLRVKGLRKGKSAAREKPRVKPVAGEQVNAVLERVPKTVRTMILVQRLLGCRPHELASMRAVNINMTGDVWEYRPERYKTEHHNDDDDPDLQRVIYIGPQAQELLKPYLSLNVSDYLFSPAESEQKRSEERRLERQSPMTPSQQARQPKTGRSRPPGDHSDVASYRRAIQRACRVAGIPSWTPNQLRHSRLTEIRWRFGLEESQAIGGHAEIGTTQIYAARDRARAQKVMAEIG
jgi:integrase